MAAKTEQFKSAGSNLGRTIGQSLSMITGKDIPNYSLLFIDATLNRKRGEHETIFMPHIVLGRSSRCHVRYGDEHKTVSREHASITVDGSNFVINHNPSASNPTYVNGRAIGGAHHLQNGDEIQLSSNGPKMRFNASTLKTSTIGLTSRIGQAMSQAVKPYKTALWIMGLLLLGSIAFSGWNMYKLSNNEKAYQMEIDSVRKQVIAGKLSIEEANKKIAEISKKPIYLPLTGGGTRPRPNNDKDNDGIQDNLDKCPNDYGIMKCDGCPTCGGETPPIPDPTYPLRDFDKDIYFITVEHIDVAASGYNGNDAVRLYNTSWSGTGFLTHEGQFITARHVLEGWKWFNVNADCTEADADPLMMALNNYSLNGGVTVTYKAVSPSGDVIDFTNKMVRVDESADRTVCGKYKQTPWEAVNTDWASINLPNRRGVSNIHINRNFSKELEKGKELFISGYARGSALQSSRKLDPLYSKGTVAQDGLIDEVINASGMSTDSGHSGGPVFAKNNKTNRYEVIGLVHGKFGGIGRVVPIWYVL